MDFLFGKPMHWRLLDLKTEFVDVDDAREYYKDSFQNTYFDRLFVGKYDAAFKHYNREDLVYSFRNRYEVAFGGLFPSSGNRPDIAILGVSLYGEDPRHDTSTSATAHRPIADFVYHMRKGLLFTGNSGLPEVELYFPNCKSLEALEEALDTDLSRFDSRQFDNFIYATKLPDNGLLPLGFSDIE